MKETVCDYVILGGGTGGLRAALACAKKGLTVLIEPGVLGGTCLNTGCIPTKAMLHSAHLYEESQNAIHYGIKNKTTLDFSRMMRHVRAIVNEGHEHVVASVDKYVQSKQLILETTKGTFIDKNTVKAGKNIYKPKKILICTGASNFVPPIPNIHDIKFLDNEKIIKLTKLPKSLIMIGGGYISMEFATFFAKLGVKVTVLERMPTILGMLDTDVREELEKSYSGVDIHTNANIISINQTKTKTTVTFNTVNKPKSKKVQVSAADIVVATGRAPNTSALNLDAAKIVHDKRGGITVNSQLQTNHKHIFAMGDCTGRALFAHAAKREVEIVLHNLTSPKKKTFDFTNVGWAVFTDPTVAGIGHSEMTAQKANINYDMYTAPFTRAGRATVISDTRGFVKILCEKKTQKIIGATIIGPHADDLIHEMIAFMQMGAKINDVKDMIHVHPTLSEVFGSLR